MPRIMPKRGSHLIRHVRRNLGKGLAFAGFLTVFLSALQLIVPLYSMEVFDRVLSSRNMDTLTMLTVLAVGALGVLGVLEFLRSRVYLIVADIMGRAINVDALKAALVEQLKGERVKATQAVRDLTDLRGFVGGNAMSAPLELVMTLPTLVLVFLIHPLFAALLAVGAVLTFALGYVSSRITRSLLREANEAAGRSFSDIVGTLRHAEVIEAMGMLPALARRWSADQELALDQLDRSSTILKAVSAATMVLRMLMQVLVMTLGVTLVLENQISAGAMIAVNMLGHRTLAPFASLVDNWRQWVFAGAAWERISALLDRGGDGRSGEGRSGDGRQTIAFPKPAARLEIDRLVFIPPGQPRPVLKGVSFTMAPGEVLGVVGPSAAGKSTLARLMVGLWEPTAGGVYLDGHNVFLWERESFGAAVGYLPQSVALLDGTVRDNIARMRADADTPEVMAEVIRAARRAGVHDMIGRLPFGYDTPVGEHGYSLSGGQKQRLALARALYGQPPLLVLDEPNANLDHDGEQALRGAVLEARRAGAAVLLIAHRPSVMQVADRLLMLREGAVERLGPREEVAGALGAPSGALPGNVRRLARSAGDAGGA